MDGWFLRMRWLWHRFTDRWLDILLVIGGMAALTATVASYAWAFHKNSVGDPEHWAQFGDYFSGVLNPFIGVITVILVVLTLRTTRKEAKQTRDQLDQQIEILKREQTLKDMQRRLDGVLAEWNRVISEQKLPHGLVLQGSPGFHRAKLREPLESLEMKSELIRLKHAWSGPGRFYANGWQHFKRDIIPLLCELDRYCQSYESLSGSRHLTDFYKARVRSAVDVLTVAGMMPDSVSERMLDIQ